MTMRVIGLTGGIGMGKSTAAKILRGFGLPIYSADKAIHDLLKKGGRGVKPVAKLFPSALKNGVIDRKIVGRDVFHHPKKLQQLERILHPLIRGAEKEFLAKARKKKVAAAVLEIPLLFETKGQSRCDFTICVTAPKKVQEERVLGRMHMTKARFEAILQRQMPDAQKRKLADYVVQTGKGLADTKRQLKAILKKELN
ncbi:MAG TPA: dephospho-CoA kinase [Alphaproteobacteria bacterium]|nr:dephospho-CoA kinase [Alphaproteobacteria bacterium]